MRSILSSLLILIFTYAFVMADAEARFGGGRSFGTQRSSTSYSRPQTTQAPRSSASAAPRSTASKWLGPLAGLAVGGLLASLFFGHGLGSGLMSWILIAGVGFLIFAFIQNRKSASSPSSSAFTNPLTAIQSHFTPTNQEVPQAESYSAPNSSTGVDPHEFLRDAKVIFMRLQASYDSKNLTDLREFTTPEVFAEIQLQLQERGDAESLTEVVSVEAEVLDISQELQSLIASIHFSGMIREKRDEAPIKFDEVWHFKKDQDMTWCVSGIQQH